MDIQAPTVTVLICNYNYGEYIQDAIDSAIEQDYQKLHLMIVDDCSNDGSSELIESTYFDGPYEKTETDYGHLMVTKHKSGRVIGFLQLNKNGGPSRARNIGIINSLEATDYYAILDADDIMYPNKISRIIQYIIGMEDVGFAYADYDIWNTDTDTVITEFKEPFDKARLLQECIVHSGSLIKKQALLDTRDRFGFYDEEMRTCEDYDLWIRISEKYVGFHVPEPLTLVRVQPQNSTQTVDNSIWQKNWHRIGLKIQARKNANVS